MDRGFKYYAGRWRILKDPAARLPYSVDWSAWTPAGDTLVSATWSAAPQGLVINADRTGFEGALATVFLEGGNVGIDYLVTCHVRLASGLEDERSFLIECRDR